MSASIESSAVRYAMSAYRPIASMCAMIQVWVMHADCIVLLPSFVHEKYGRVLLCWFAGSQNVNGCRQHIKVSFELVVLATLALPLVPCVPLTLAPLVRLAVFILPLRSVSGLLGVPFVPICVAGCAVCAACCADCAACCAACDIRPRCAPFTRLALYYRSPSARFIRCVIYVNCVIFAR